MQARLRDQLSRHPRAVTAVVAGGAVVLLVVAVGLAFVVFRGAMPTGEASAVPSASANSSSSPTSEASPSATAEESVAASATPVEPVPASWTATANMIEARTNHTATQLLNGQVLVAGGVGTSTSEFFANILASAELYDPSTGQWTTTGAMAGNRVGHTATLLPDGKVLVAGGGSSSDGDGGPLSSAELYDPDTGTWTVVANMLDARNGGHTATLMNNGKVLVAGGNASSFEALASAELYDPISRSWSASANMLEARSGQTATLLLDGKVLLAGSGSLVASAELYDPGSGQWTATGSMGGVAIGHTATLLLDGRVLAAGGMAGTGALASAVLYDPRTRQWTATGAMLEARLFHTATLLPGGRVLVAGGTNSVIDGGVPSTTAELFDLGAGSWTATAGMLEVHSRQATLLRNGRVLVAGGSGSNFEPVATAEVYDPGSGN